LRETIARPPHSICQSSLIKRRFSTASRISRSVIGGSCRAHGLIALFGQVRIRDPDWEGVGSVEHVARGVLGLSVHVAVKARGTQRDVCLEPGLFGAARKMETGIGAVSGIHAPTLDVCRAVPGHVGSDGRGAILRVGDDIWSRGWVAGPRGAEGAVAVLGEAGVVEDVSVWGVLAQSGVGTPAEEAVAVRKELEGALACGYVPFGMDVLF